MAKLITQDVLHATIKGMESLKLDVTLSLAFYGIVHGDISALSGLDKNIVNRLHKDYKALIPAVFHKNTKEWLYSRVKAEEMQEKHGIVYQTTTFEEFYDLVCKEAEVKVEKTDTEKMDAQKESVKRALVKALSMGITKEVLAALLTDAKAK